MKEMLTLCTKNVHFTFNGDKTTKRRSCYGFPFRSSSCLNIHCTLGKISSSRSKRPTLFLETIRLRNNNFYEKWISRVSVTNFK